MTTSSVHPLGSRRNLAFASGLVDEVLGACILRPTGSLQAKMKSYGTLGVAASTPSAVGPVAGPVLLVLSTDGLRLFAVGPRGPVSQTPLLQLGWEDVHCSSFSTGFTCQLALTLGEDVLRLEGKQFPIGPNAWTSQVIGLATTGLTGES